MSIIYICDVINNFWDHWSIFEEEDLTHPNRQQVDEFLLTNQSSDGFPSILRPESRRSGYF